MPYRNEDLGRVDTAFAEARETTAIDAPGAANARKIQIMIVVGLVAAIVLAVFGN